MGFEAFGWANWLAPERYEKTKNSSGDLADFERQVLAVKGLFDAKLIKHWGLSNENAFGLTMFCMLCDKHGVPRPVSCQNDFSFNNRVYEGDLAEACHHFGVAACPTALGGGMLTEAPRRQCVECCAAMRLEPLPDELNAKIDAIHERYRSPSAALCSKNLVMAAPWLDDDGAKKRRTD
ncbi:oxidoreductase [Aureococcus anophagefferens]|nr:oxidoreductase [Aureococcus anophagefferens]